MRWTSAFIPTLRDDPADAEAASHKLLVRGGFIRQLAAGTYSLLPLAQRVARKIEAIIRSELERIGGQEFSLPALQPAELWKQSGRWDAIDANMFRLEDRHGAELVSGHDARGGLHHARARSCAPIASSRRSGTSSRPSSATRSAPSPACCACASS